MQNNLLNEMNEKVTMNAGRPVYVDSWKPSVEEECASGIREVLLQTRHFSKGRIFLVGEVTDEMANDFVSEMIYFVEKKQPVDIYINSPGGSVNAGLVIYDMIQACAEKIEINMYCIGMAASMAAVLLAGGPKGHRFILPHSQVMIHEVRTLGGVGGTVTSIKKIAESISETNDITAGILAKHTGKTVDEILEATSFDNYMNAEKAIEFGICDEVKNPLINF